MTENCVLVEVTEPEVPVLEAATGTEADPGEVPEMSQATEGETVVEMDRTEEQDGQADRPPKEDVSTTETAKQITWEVGARCQAMWSKDRKIYPATVVAVDGERCRVRFGGYGDEEDMELSALQSAPVETQSSQLQDWKPGSRCRAVYSVDGLVYPAVILWVKGQRCRVRYDEYNNEEELDVSSLLHPDELHGPSRATKVKGGSWKSNPPSGNLDWKREMRGESQGGRGGERRSTLREDPNSDRMKERNGHQNKAEEEKRKRDPTCDFFPSFAPPQIGSMDPLSFIPPPPPAWTFCGKEQGDCPDVNTITNMLMLWYMCGFHTGSFVAQQRSTPSSKDKSMKTEVP